jgi:hypothetical protein
MNKSPLHEIVETAAFTARLGKMGVSEAERVAIYDAYATDPSRGAVIRRTGGLRTGRIAKDNTGKSGGYRVFSFYADEHNPVFLLWIIDKTDEENLTAEQEQVFRKLIATLKEGLK